MKASLARRDLSSGQAFGYRKVKMSRSERYEGTSFGGLAAMRCMALKLVLDKEINDSLSLLKVRRGYAESDHILTMALNPLHGGQTLEDLARLRRDKALLQTFDARGLPAPSTAGDFCRRFDESRCDALQEAINRTRLKVWSSQPESFFERASIDADGVFVTTASECSEGVEYNGFKKEWGMHPLVVSLAETSEPLFIVNRAGARPSHEGAHCYFDKSIEICKQAGFKQIILRGDTDFSQTKFLDGWDKQENVDFVFGMDAHPALVARAEAIPDSAWRTLRRRTRKVDEDDQRAKQPRIKHEIIREKGYRNLELEREDLAEIEYQPRTCKQVYRLVVLRKTIRVNRGAELLMPEIRCYFYISNLKTHSAREIVKEANDRCNQENLNSHLKSGVHALRAPLKTLQSNGAYMIATGLAWSLKAWFAMVGKFDAPDIESQQALSRRLLTMEFRTFLMELICIPALVIESGRQLIVRTLSNPPWLRHLLAAHASFNE